jgi:hypothetical protein
MKLPEVTYFDPRIDYRIANPDDVPSGNTITAQPLAPLSRICNSVRNIGQFAIAAQPSASLSRICNSARNIRQFAIAAQRRLAAIVVETRCIASLRRARRVQPALSMIGLSAFHIILIILNSFKFYYPLIKKHK